MSNYRNIDSDRLAGMLKALANPTRLKVFLRLVDCCSGGRTRQARRQMPGELCACVGELGEQLNIAASTLSHHVRKLREAGLVDIQRHGQHMVCRVSDAPLRELSEFFGGLGALGCCAQ